ncbi:MAG: Na/Pi cotransporter family protein [Proteobacteria bacterium]|nr:MAG: Na/Pi cotransporter family protein [Pseudomonadota bacterium]
MTAQLLNITGLLLGGLGLFLLAVGMMTDGLRLAAGASLRHILATWTNSTWRGLSAGVLMTAIVQSSSAVIVATIGFVNAGLLSMRQTLGILYGANIGTSMTGWLVAVVGFKFNIQAVALPMIGIGMLIRLFRKSEGRLSSLALALVGFGLFFVGIDILKSAFEGIVSGFDVSTIEVQGLYAIFVFFLVGIVMTLLTQSSSAAIAITITAAASGILPLYSATAMVIGAIIGTSSTSLLTTIGATANAKRVAWAQVILNTTTACVAFVILPLLVFLMEKLSFRFNLELSVGIQLALFHTAFNIFGVLCFLPFNNKLAGFLENRFKSLEAHPTQPKYLDSAIALSPTLAINALVLELKEIAERVRTLPQADFTTTTVPARFMAERLRIITDLSKQVSDFIVVVEQHALSEDTSKQLVLLLRIDEYLLTCAQSINTIYHHYQRSDTTKLGSFKFDINLYKDSILTNTDFLTTPDHDSLQIQVKKDHDTVKNKLLNLGSSGQISFDTMVEVLDILREQLHMAQQWLKAMNSLYQVESQTQSPDQADNPDISDDETIYDHNP